MRNSLEQQYVARHASAGGSGCAARCTASATRVQLATGRRSANEANIASGGEHEATALRAPTVGAFGVAALSRTADSIPSSAMHIGAAASSTSKAREPGVGALPSISRWPSIHLFPIPKLAGAASVALRQIRADDAAALQDFVRALSPASRRLRFHAALSELPGVTLQALTRVDQRAHVAFVLTSKERGTERIVGEARYVVSGEAETAEFGIAVADGFRGLGLADRLLAALVDTARAAGLRWLVGDVLADNSRMLAFVRRCGFAETTRGVEPGLVRVERCVDRPLVPAQAAESLTGTVRRRVRRVLTALTPSPRGAAPACEPF